MSRLVAEKGRAKSAEVNVAALRRPSRWLSRAMDARRTGRLREGLMTPRAHAESVVERGSSGRTIHPKKIFPGRLTGRLKNERAVGVRLLLSPSNATTPCLRLHVHLG